MAGEGEDELPQVWGCAWEKAQFLFPVRSPDTSQEPCKTLPFLRGEGSRDGQNLLDVWCALGKGAYPFAFFLLGFATFATYLGCSRHLHHRRGCLAAQALGEHRDSRLPDPHSHSHLNPYPFPYLHTHFHTYLHPYRHTDA